MTTTAARTAFAPVPLAEVPAVAEALRDAGLGAFVPGRVSSYPGRNDNWFGPTTTGREVFVKRLAGPRVQERLARVSAFDHSLRTCSRPMSWQVPRTLTVRPDLALTVSDYLAEATVVSDVADKGELDPALCGRIGRSLGELHQLPPPDEPSATAGTVPPTTGGTEGGPLFHLSEKTWQTASAGELEAWSLLQHDPELVRFLSGLHSERTDGPATAVHGDLRLDQFLLHDHTLYLTDWEEFRQGEPAKDVGAAVGELLWRAMRHLADDLDVALCDDSEACHRAVLANGREALATVRPLVVALTEGYAAAGGEVSHVRVARLAGVQLIDRFLARARQANRLSPLDRSQAGIGRTLLLNPRGVAAALGLKE